MSDELAVLMPNDNMSNRDVVLHYRDGDLGHISELHWSYDPLQYQLRFCMVLMGGMSICNYRMVKKLTSLVYYHYHIMIRKNVSVLLKAKRLF